MRLFGLLHLLGQASLGMEKTLWPEDYERITRDVEEALREADDPNCSIILIQTYLWIYPHLVDVLAHPTQAS